MSLGFTRRDRHRIKQGRDIGPLRTIQIQKRLEKLEKEMYKVYALFHMEKMSLYEQNKDFMPARLSNDTTNYLGQKFSDLQHQYSMAYNMINVYDPIIDEHVSYQIGQSFLKDLPQEVVQMVSWWYSSR